MKEVANVEQALSQYFINAGYLTQAHIDCLKQKLNGVQPAVLPDKYVIPVPTADAYKSITVKCYSPGGAPLIWWWGGGEKITKTSQTINPKTGTNYTWDTRPKMPSVASAWTKAGLPVPEGVADWYYWTFTDVDGSVGISYIFTAHGKGQSADLNAVENECRDASYNLVADCPELPSRVLKDWNVSNTTLFGTAPVTYSADTDFDGLTVHAMDQDNRRWEVKACTETCGEKVFTQYGATGGAAKETFRYFTFAGTEGQELEVWAQGGSNIDRALNLGLGDYQAENVVSTDTIRSAEVTYIHYVLPKDGTYYIYTAKGNWNLYAAVLSAATLATLPGEGDEEWHEALLNTSVETQVQKKWVNGQLFIIRDGRIYNALGVKIK